jgi:phosphoglycerol transferase MdoB-like AlkP superfamily enzyme
VTKSFEYSKNLVKGRWWEMFGYWIFSLVSTIVLWFALWYIPYVETIYGDVISSLIIDLYASFVIIIFALKFLNIDRNKQEDNIEVWSENDKVIEL